MYHFQIKLRISRSISPYYSAYFRRPRLMTWQPHNYFTLNFRAGPVCKNTKRKTLWWKRCFSGTSNPNQHPSPLVLSNISSLEELRPRYWYLSIPIAKKKQITVLRHVQGAQKPRNILTIWSKKPKSASSHWAFSWCYLSFTVFTAC